MSSQLTRLSLEATRSRRPDLSVLARFRNLRRLYLERQSKGIAVVTRLQQLEEVTLRSVTAKLDWISDLPRLRSFALKLGGAVDLAPLAAAPSLQRLEIWQVRGLADLEVVSRLRALQWLKLQSLPQVERLPDMRGLSELRWIILINMRALRDFRAAQAAPGLLAFELLDGAKQAVEDLLPVLRNPQLRQASAYFGSKKRNEAFERLRNELGIEPCKHQLETDPPADL